MGGFEDNPRKGLEKAQIHFLVVGNSKTCTVSDLNLQSLETRRTKKLQLR